MILLASFFMTSADAEYTITYLRMGASYCNGNCKYFFWRLRFIYCRHMFSVHKYPWCYSRLLGIRGDSFLFFRITLKPRAFLHDGLLAYRCYNMLVHI